MSIIKHSVEFRVNRHSGRFNVFAWHYYDIAESSYNEFLKAKENFVPMPDNDDPREHFDSEARMLYSSFQTIVFSGLACEAAIYDLAARHLGDEYTSKYLDKLDLVSKWMIIPPLICGKSLNEEGPAINSLRTLVRIRNALVHHKSSPAFPLDVYGPRAEAQIERMLHNTDTAFKAVVLLSLELNRLLKIQTGALPFFEKGIKRLSGKVMRKSIEQVIKKCRDIDKRNKP